LAAANRTDATAAALIRQLSLPALPLAQDIVLTIHHQIVTVCVKPATSPCLSLESKAVRA